MDLMNKYSNIYTNSNIYRYENMDVSDKVYLGLCSFIIIGLLFSASLNRL
jgi:hypothetical protein